MASTTRVLLSAAALVAVVHLAASAAAPSPSSCAAGQAGDLIPGCSWYVASRLCKGLVGMYQPEIFREMCCQQLEAVPAACRCKALRAILEVPLNFVGGGPKAEACRLAQARSAHDLVPKAECDLPATHGWPTCSSE
ncbi:unnamed protein product [Urochloa humidicola]